MNEVLNSGASGLASLAISVMVLIVGLVLWLFVNWVSPRTNEQVELPEVLLGQQKRQNVSLRRLYEANEPGKAAEPAVVTAKDEDDDIIRLVAEW